MDTVLMKIDVDANTVLMKIDVDANTVLMKIDVDANTVLMKIDVDADTIRMNRLRKKGNTLGVFQVAKKGQHFERSEWVHDPGKMRTRSG